jgi:tight adherence protein C
MPTETSSLDALHAPAWQRLMAPLARLAAPAAQAESDTAAAQNAVGRTAQEVPDEHGVFVPTAHRERFMQAGLRARSAPVAFYAAKVALALGLPLLAGLTMHLWGRPLSGLPAASALLGSALLGLQLPGWWLSHRLQRRQRELFEAFPDAIDLVIVCIEAGLGIDAALERTGRDMALRSPALSDELALLSAELRLGVSRPQALRHLGMRTGVEEIRSFAVMLAQTERLGTGVADALRVHAQALRLARERRAEEAAAKLPLKLLFPLLFTLFPALMVVLMGPAVISLVRQVGPLVNGG